MSGEGGASGPRFRVAELGCILPDLPFIPLGPFDESFRAEIEATVKLDVADVANTGQALELFRGYREPS